MAHEKALLILDMVRAYLDPESPLFCQQAREILPAVNRELEYYRDRHRPVFFTYPADLGVPEGFSGALHPGPSEGVIGRKGYSAFYGTDLEHQLNGLGIRELWLVGVFSNVAVLYTAADAMNRGLHVVVPDPCVAARDPEDHRFAIRQMRDVLEPL